MSNPFEAGETGIYKDVLEQLLEDYFALIHPEFDVILTSPLEYIDEDTNLLTKGYVVTGNNVEGVFSGHPFDDLHVYTTSLAFVEYR